MAQWFQAISGIPNKTIRANKKTVNEVYLFDSVSFTEPGQNLRIWLKTGQFSTNQHQAFKNARGIL
jgi:hypothetical protein